MIQQLIEAYLSKGGKRPFAVMFPVGVYDDVPVDVLCVWTPLITGRVLVTSLLAASTLLNESVQLLVKEEEKKEETVDA